MAKDAANYLGNKLLGLDKKHRQYLAGIRHWNNLKMAIDGEMIWIKDFSELQWTAAELKSIPYARFYRTEDHLLFPEGSRLPVQKMPALLWTPIEKAMPVSLPDLNHNYFGIGQRLSIVLVPSEQEQQPSALITSLEILNDYLVQAPAIRLQNLQWCILNKEKTLIVGEPLLPVSGASFWQYKSFIIPAGYELEFPELINTIEQKTNPDKDHWILWQTAENYTAIPKNKMKPLTLSSFRLTIENNIP